MNVIYKANCTRSAHNMYLRCSETPAATRHVSQSLDLKPRQTTKHGWTESEREENDFVFLD